MEVELDEFAKLLNLVAKPMGQRSMEEKRAIRQLDTRLDTLLNAVTGNRQYYHPALRSRYAAGQWVRDKLRPKTVASGASGSVSLAIDFEGVERTMFAAPIYLWLNRLATGKLDTRCFPQELLAGVEDARVRAAAKGKYAFQDNDVELVINTGGSETFRLARFDGGVDVTD
jgi:hypothetical protein